MKKMKTEPLLELVQLQPEDPFHKTYYWKRAYTCSKELLAVAV